MTVLPRQDIKDVAQVVQEQLNKAGFKVELKNQELGQFIQDWRNSNFDLFASTNAGSPDPDDYFYRTFRTGGSTNVFKYSNPEIDTAARQRARRRVDTGARKAAYAKVQKHPRLRRAGRPCGLRSAVRGAARQRAGLQHHRQPLAFGARQRLRRAVERRGGIGPSRRRSAPSWCSPVSSRPG